MEPQQTDTLYQTYGRDLHRLSADDQNDQLQSMVANPDANLSGSVNMPPDSIGSGVGTGDITQGTGNLSAGQESYADGSNGYWIGVVNGVAKISIGPNSGNHLTWDGSTLTIVGSVNIGSLNIPDTTTTASFHVDSTGNAWAGANVANKLTAPLRLNNDGSAIFQNVAIGGTTIQYVITNSGIFSFGDGSDGDVTVSVNTTLVADKYYNNLTVNSGVTLNAGGYRVFVKNTMTLNGTIARNGANGSTAAVSMADGYLKGAATSGAGGGGQVNASGLPGGAGSNTSNSLGTSGSSGQAGGDPGTLGTGHVGGAGGAGGTATASNVKLIANWHLGTLLDISATGATVKFDNSGGGGGGGAGGSGVGGDAGAGGGAGGGGGGIVAIYARSIVISATGSITSTGGNGGDGGTGGTATVPDRTDGNGGGGAGGNGGIIIMTYNALTNAGSITAAGGTGGMGGGNPGQGTIATVAKTAANSGSAGTIYQFQLSL